MDLPTEHSQFLGSFGIANKGKTYVAQIPGFVIPTLKGSVEKFQGFCGYVIPTQNVSLKKF